MAKIELGSRSAASLAMLLVPIIAQAQVTFDLSSIARPGDTVAVPPELGLVYGAPSVNEGGDVAFEADGAVFLHSKGTTRALAGFGDPVPGGGTFTSARSPSLNAQGQVAFVGQVTPPGRSGIFLFTGGAVTQVVSTNDFSPEGGRFFGFYEVSLNDAGQMAFHAFASMGEGIFLSSPGAITVLALEGRPAPGGGSFSGLSSPAINASGQVVFSTLSFGIYLAVDGTVIRVARIGDPAPDGHGASFVSFQFPASISDAGEVSFGAYATPPGRGGIYRFSAGLLSLVIADGDPAPEGDAFLSVVSSSVNASGQIAFLGRVSEVPGLGVFLLSKGGLTRVMSPLQPSPEGDLFTGARYPAVNNTGQVAFTATLANHLGGIYLYSEGAIARMVGQGDPIDRKPRISYVTSVTLGTAGRVFFSAVTFPGGDGLFDEARNPIARPGDPAPEGGVFTRVSLTGGNDRGQLVFVAWNSRGGSGLYLSSEGRWSRIVGTGDPAPEGQTFSSFLDASLNDKGEIAFLAGVFPSNTLGLYVGSDVFRRLVSEGDPAPGGGTFTRLAFFVSLNDSGQVLFNASVAAPGRSGIFLWSDGSVRAIAQVGDAAPGGGTFSSFSQQSLNASGQVAFDARLSQGSGVFLSSGGVVSSIVRSGDAAPDGTISSADSPSLNDAGQVALLATVRNQVGVYLLSGGLLSTIVRERDPAPGGNTFALLRSPRLDEQSQVAFLADVSGGAGASGAFLATPQAFGSSGVFVETPYASSCTGVIVDTGQR